MKPATVLRWTSPFLFVPLNLVLIWPRNPVVIACAFVALGLMLAFREHMINRTHDGT